MKTFAVIMAGGSGTRLWPASRSRLPKQYLPIGEERSLVAQTLSRLAGLVPIERTLVVSAHSQADALAKALPDLPRENMLLEPCARNTAACVAWAAAEISRRDPDSLQIVLPADHVIRPVEKLRASLGAGLDEARESRALITFGIRPTRAATGFGYIELGAALGDRGAHPVFSVRRFVEKPNEERAKEFLAAGGFLWNAGIFAWRTGSILAALERHAPSVIRPFVGLPVGQELERIYADLPKLSIDVAVMEREPDVRTLPLDYFWSDVGAWTAMDDVLVPDTNGNRVTGGTLMEALDASNNIVYGEQGQLVALLGVENLVVVRSGDALLVTTREHADQVRALVERMASDRSAFV